MKQISNNHLLFANNAMLRGLDFYKLELQFMQTRLDEIAGDNTGTEVTEKVFYFQNKIGKHSENLDELKRRIHADEKMVEYSLRKTGGFVDDRTVIVVDQLTDDYHMEEMLINNLRHEFNLFAAEWM